MLNAFNVFKTFWSFSRQDSLEASLSLCLVISFCLRPEMISSISSETTSEQMRFFLEFFRFGSCRSISFLLAQPAPPVGPGLLLKNGASPNGDNQRLRGQRPSKSERILLKSFDCFFLLLNKISFTCFHFLILQVVNTKDLEGLILKACFFSGGQKY